MTNKAAERSSENGFLPFALPDIGEEEIAEVVSAMRSGWITTGPKTRQFEQDFATFIGGGVTAVAVNSATAGLHLALEALQIGAGDEVIVPTHTFTATAEVVRYLGADPVFVDIDPRSHCLDPNLVASAVTARTKAIIPVHYGGRACEMDEILRIARERSLAVVEDAAHALPTTYKGVTIGALASDATVFSFYATKTIATGEGGMLVTRRTDVAKRAAIMRLHGIDRDAFDRYTAKKPAWYYEVVAPGFKYNMTDLAAAIGVHQLRKAHRFFVRRREMADRYRKELADLPLIQPQLPPPGESHAWHLYVVELTDAAPLGRDALIEELYRRGIGCSVHYVPLHLQPYWRDRYGLRPAQFPHSQRLYERSLSLPIYTRMTDADQTRVIRALHEVLK
jgi:dTDP-4-amino-4,6-dideoxygalactose transaminase